MKKDVLNTVHLDDLDSHDNATTCPTLRESLPHPTVYHPVYISLHLCTCVLDGLSANGRTRMISGSTRCGMIGTMWTARESLDRQGHTPCQGKAYGFPCATFPRALVLLSVGRQFSSDFCSIIHNRSRAFLTALAARSKVAVVPLCGFGLVLVPLPPMEPS